MKLIIVKTDRQEELTTGKVFVTYSRIAASSTVDPPLEVLTATLQIQIFETA